MKTLEEFVRDFISLTRKRKESKEFPLELFHSPCQATALFIKNHSVVVLIIKHEPKLKDLEVTNYVVNSLKDAHALVNKKVLTNPYWAERSALVEIAGLLGSCLKVDYATSIRRARGFTAHLIGYKKERKRFDGCMVFFLDEEKHSPNDLLLRVLESIDRRRQRERIMSKREKEDVYIFSAFWYPPFVFQDELITLDPRFVIDTKYKGYRILFDNKSFISILSPIKPPIGPFEDKGLEILNEIIGTANLFGIDGTAVTRDEIVYFEYSKDLKYRIGIGRKPTPTIRSVVFEDYCKDPPSIYRFGRFCRFNQFKKSDIEDLVKKAERIMQNEEIANYISLYLDAKTHLLANQPKSAFLLAWIVVEKYVNDIWSKTLTDRGISGKRYSKLIKSILWTIDDELEALNLMGQLSNKRYFQINRLKSIRNAVIHKERKVQPQEAEECVKLVVDIVRELVRDRCFVE